MPRAHIDINSAGILANYAAYCRFYARPIIAVLKANGYGHGALIVAQTLAPTKALFALATLEEAMQLRRAGITNRLLVFASLSLTEMRIAQREGIEVSLNSMADLARAKRVPGLLVHIKINTGLNRLGFSPNTFSALQASINQHVVKVKGIFTHYATKADTKRANARFAAFLKRINNPHQFLIHTGEAHTVYPAANAIRVGIGLYGLSDCATFPLTPVFTLKAPIMQRRAVLPGTRVGYHYQSKVPGGYLYTLGVGYGDGWLMQLTPLVEGFQLAGPVCMDLIILYSPNLIPITSEITLISPETIHKYVKAGGVNPYQLVTNFNSRLIRRSV